MLERAPASPQVVAIGIPARARLLALGARLGMSSEESRRLFDEARALAGRDGDGRQLTLLHLAYGEVRGFVGEVEEGLALTREAVALAARAGDPRLLLRARVALTYALVTAGRFLDAVALAEQLLEELGDGGSQRQRAFVLFFHAMVCVDLGRPADAQRDLELAADLAWRHGDVELLAQVYSFAPVVTRTLGLPGVATASTRRSARSSSPSTSATRSVACSPTGVWARPISLAGDGRTATRILNGVVLLARDHGVGLQGEAGMLAELACATLLRGDGALALSIAEEAVQVARRRRVALYEAIALSARAWILLETGGATAAAEIESCLAARARDRGQRRHGELRGAGPLPPGDAGRAARRPRRPARASWSGRAALSRAMGATGWVERVERRLQGEVAA